MKKYLFPIGLSLFIGVFMAFLLIKSYDNSSALVSKKDTYPCYFIQAGVYSNIDNMTSSMSGFDEYIYSVEDNFYHTYVAMTTNQENSEKLKKYYEKLGYSVYVNEKNVTNDEFIKVLRQYDNILLQTEDDDTIKVIENQVIRQYKTLEKVGDGK